MFQPDLPPRRSPAKHQAILAAATALAGELGYQPVTLEAVAARAGVGKQTIYRWWPSKAALFVEAYAGLVGRDTLAADTGTAAGDLRALLLRLFTSFAATPAARILAGLVGAAPSDPAAAAAVRQGLVTGRADLLEAPLHRAIARGELPAAFDVPLAARVIVALIWREVLLDPAALTPVAAEQILAAGLAAGAAHGG